MSEPRHVEAILVAGVAASGKSAFGCALAARLRWTLLDLDTLTNPLFEYAGGDDRASRASTTNPLARSELDRARYACLYDSARENLSVGQNVILVAPFTSERTSRHEWEGVPGRLGIRSDFVHLVWLDTPILEVARRMSQRAASRDVGKLATLEPTDAVAPPAVDHLRLDGMLEPARQVELFLRERELLRR
ncbi:MAG TPA: AAA family ATPase [Microbacteriaceae bacterium]|jgi:predicted kinase|nr:AAA family ATPase [Microbacteriaceae bacterium]